MRPTPQAADLPTITVLQEGAALFSLNNRRLWLFKQVAMPQPTLFSPRPPHKTI